MTKTNIQVFLSKDLPIDYLEPPITSKEAPIEGVEELMALYANKYGTFGEIQFHLYDPLDAGAFCEALNKLFEDMGSETKVDQQLLREHIDQVVPLIVVDHEVVSQGIYPDLTNLRGGSNSISRGGTGHHH